MWWHDTMQVVLAPERIRYRIHSTLRRKASVADIVDCAAGAEDKPWRAACATLAAIMADGMARHSRLEVVVSDRLVRYQVLPWRPEIASRAEWRAYARHVFEATYGEVAQGWRLKIDLVPPGQPSLACAIDADLVDSLREIAAAGTSRLTAVRPSFVTLFNRRRAAVRGSKFWFGAVESGNIALGAHVNGGWRIMRNESMPTDLPSGLSGMVRRSQFALAEPCDGTLYLCGDIDQDALPDSIGDLRIRVLASAPRGGVRGDAGAVAGV